MAEEDQRTRAPFGEVRPNAVRLYDAVLHFGHRPNLFPVGWLRLYPPAERKLSRRQLTEDSIVEISGRDLP